MADKKKIINKSLPSDQRYIKFTNTELTTGDIIRVSESLGRVADTLTIEISNASDLSIKVNPKVKIPRPRAYPEQEPFGWADLPNMADLVEVDTGVPSLTIGGAAALSYSLTDLPVDNLEVTFTSGTFSIILS